MEKTLKPDYRFKNGVEIFVEPRGNYKYTFFIKIHNNPKEDYKEKLHTFLHKKWDKYIQEAKNDFELDYIFAARQDELWRFDSGYFVYIYDEVPA